MLGLFVVLFVFLSSFLLLFHQRKRYWEARGVRSPNWFPGQYSIHFFLGERWETFDKYYRKYKSDGMFALYDFTQVEIFISDLDAVKDIMVQDFDYFSGRRPLLPWPTRFDGRINLRQGERWKNLRDLLSRGFTSGKIKAMFEIIEQKVDDLDYCIECDMEERGKVLVRDVIAHFSVDVVCGCVFSIDTNCLRRDLDPRETREVITSQGTGFSTESLCFTNIVKNWINNIKTRKDPNKPKPFLSYFEKYFRQLFRQRKREGEYGDILDLVFEMEYLDGESDSKSKADNPMNKMLAQTLIFLFAGYDTIANGLVMVLYHLGKHPKVQQKLRKELIENLTGEGCFNYENLMACDYLDAVLSEGLRIDPPLNLYPRICTKDYTFRNKNLTIKRGTAVTLPVWNLHHDPEYWTDPESFIPERFLPENKADIVPYSYMPFGIGPRNCIGMQVAKLMSKILISKLFLKYDMEVLKEVDRVECIMNPFAKKPLNDSVIAAFNRVEY